MISKEVQENTKEKILLPETINVKTENDAKQLVKNLKRDGYNGREILKTKIMIGDKKFPLNISKIKKICESEQTSNEQIELTDADFFKLYEKGFTPNDVVPRLKCSFDKADKPFIKYQKYSGMVLVSSKDQETLFLHLRKMYPYIETLSDAIPWVKMAVESNHMLLQYRYRCDVCGKTMVIGSGERASVIKHLEDHYFGHDYCHTDNY